MNFNFTQEDLQAADERKVFNKGVAGRVKGVKVTMTDDRATKTNENAPDFKVFFEDLQGNKTNKACFSIKEPEYPNQWGTTYEEAMKKEWAFLNKIVEHTGGTPVMSFKDDTDLFTQVMNNIGPARVNVFANYGTTRSPKDNIEIRKFLPAVEAGDTPDADTKLKPTGVDQMVEIVPDAPDGEAAADSLFG
jgi:hypothetical protein